MRSWRPALEWMAVVAATALLMFRFVWLDQAPFINDEAAMVEAGRQQLLTGSWAMVSPLRGNMGLSYGPSVIWFYGLVQRITGSAAVLTCLGAMCALLTAAHVALAVALTRLFAPRSKIWFFALVLAFIASSPYQFFWSRLAWDQITGVVSFAVVALLCTSSVGWKRSLLIGALLGLGFSSHPMISAFIGLAVIALAAAGLRERRVLTTMLPALAGFVLVNLPYFIAVARTGVPRSVRPRFHLPIEAFLETFRPASLWKISYFFDGDWADFVHSEWIGVPLASSVSIGAVLVLTALGLARVFREAAPPRRRVLLLAAAACVVHPLFLASTGLPLHPHYQFPTGWVVPVAVAAALSWEPRLPAARWVVRSAVLLLVLLHAFFIWKWDDYIRQRGGTRGVHYSTPVGQQVAAVEAACSLSARRIQLENQTLLFPVSLAYHSRVLPTCQGKQVVICAPPWCPRRAGDWGLFLLRYAQPRGGRIAWERIEPRGDGSLR